MPHRQAQPPQQLPIIEEVADDLPAQIVHFPSVYEDMDHNPNVIYDLPGEPDLPVDLPAEYDLPEEPNPPEDVRRDPDTPPPIPRHNPNMPPETPRPQTAYGKQGRILPRKRLSFEDALYTPEEPGSSNYGPVTRSKATKHPVESIGGPRQPGTPYVLPPPTPEQAEQIRLMKRIVKKPKRYDDLLRHSYDGPSRKPPKQ